MRTFISIDFPLNLKKEIVKIQRQLPMFNGKITEEANLHLTLKFLGEIDENKLQEVRKRLEKIEFNSFEIEIGTLGIFSKKVPGIIWISLGNCEELQKKIDEALYPTFEKENRFMGHLTIGRIKFLKNKEEFMDKLNNLSIKKFSFPVKEFYLKKSILTKKAPLYETLEKYSCGTYEID